MHLVCGLPVKFRVDGHLVNAGVNGDEPLSHDDCERFARELAGHDFDRIERIGELDRAETIAGVRVRINLFRQQGHVSAALRLLSDVIPALDRLGLPPAVLEFPKIQRGIVVVTGETGSGKSTTLAALIDAINHTRAENIITMEDPIEYLYTPDQSIISQREIGQDTASYHDALRAVLREDPDIILIGEMRDLDTIQTALTAAETGHFVLATLHTSAADSIDRMVDVFPEGLQRQVRMQLSTTLVAVLSQQLLPRRDGMGRALACELMMVARHPQPHPRGQGAADSRLAGHVGLGGQRDHGQRADRPGPQPRHHVPNRHRCRTRCRLRERAFADANLHLHRDNGRRPADRRRGRGVRRDRGHGTRARSSAVSSKAWFPCARAKTCCPWTSRSRRPSRRTLPSCAPNSPPS
ncbi:MAG: type IV pilus twitching motility protein PilT [Eggerthellaceae bacterium]